MADALKRKTEREEFNASPSKVTITEVDEIREEIPSKQDASGPDVDRPGVSVSNASEKVHPTEVHFENAVVRSMTGMIDRDLCALPAPWSTTQPRAKLLYFYRRRKRVHEFVHQNRY